MRARIRPIEKKDNAAIKALVIDTLRDEFGRTGKGYACGDPELDDLYSFYQQPRACYYVVENLDTGKILGGGGLSRLKGTTDADNICEMQKFFFHASLRGQGIGNKLVGMLVNDARMYGFGTMYLETLPEMQPAQALYRRYGFRSLQAPLGSTGHTGCGVFMTLDLALPETNKAATT